MLVCSSIAALAQEEGYELALVTDVGNIDDQSFNQGAWEGVVAFATENNVSYAYYRPSEDSTEARVESIKAAIDKGAKTVVLPGYLFEDAVYDVQGSTPRGELPAAGRRASLRRLRRVQDRPNTHCILYKEEQADYLAGLRRQRTATPS